MNSKVLAVLALGLTSFVAADAVAARDVSSVKGAAGYRTALSIEQAVVDVADKVGKAVVSISTVRTEKMPSYRRFYFDGPGGDSDIFEDELFRRFFEDFFDVQPQQQRQSKQVGLGSGVIIDKDGYILTNEHVIDDADKITVTLPDGREFLGEIRGRDSRADLAVIKIDAKDLPAAELGDSDKMDIGRWVVAIGNPFGFVMHSPKPTVTVGVVSALHRSLGRSLSRGKDFSDLIQTDAAINPGNSGGPLVNLEGKVIGINVAIFSTSGGYQGIGFAIPSNRAQRVLTRLIQGKKVLYGWLGITAQDLDSNLADYFGLRGRAGVLVNEVIVGGPADHAGLKDGDIIRSFDGEDIASVRALLRAVAKTNVGQRVRLGIIRGGRVLAATVKIGQRPEDNIGRAAGAYPSPADRREKMSWRGITVRDIDYDLRQRYSLEDTYGVLVVAVEQASPADDAGILPGDIIREINKVRIKDSDDFHRVTSGIEGDALLRTRRGYIVIAAHKK
ncbi:MAG: Do family serine endopeptidase [Candidatus Omnitrophota bacterium]